jgi:fructuronate reductase
MNMDAAAVPRLSSSTLSALAGRARVPAYDRAQTVAGVVHLGIGAFHRAHQAVYFDDLLARGHHGYAVTGASLRSAEVARQLAPQDGLYGVLTLADAHAEYRIVGAVREVLVATDDPAALVARLAARATALVTLTVTEKGYCHRPSDDTLDLQHEDIRHDLQHPQSPRSAVGFLAAMLAARFQAALPPPTVLCCDNLPHNGRLLAGLVRSFAEAQDRAAFARWIEDAVRFPCTMVDRIVPATTDLDRAAVARRYGIDDQGLVKAEPFSQWVIEDLAETTRPLGDVGALLVGEVAPFETMKLRLLNGAHSTVAYLGYLAGCEYVAEAMTVPGMDTLVARLMDREVTPTLRVPADFDLAGYKHALRARFANPALQHRTWQIAMDGSQKLPQRLLGSARERLAAAAPVDALALAVAAWMRYVGGVDEQGRAIDVRDPLAARLAILAAPRRAEAATTVDALLGVREVFDPALAQDPRWRAALVLHYERLLRLGARGAIAALVAPP